MPQSDRSRSKAQQDRVANVVAAVLSDSDADLHNLAVEALDADALQAVFALAKLAAAAIEQHAHSMEKLPVDVLRSASLAAFGHTPKIV